MNVNFIGCNMCTAAVVYLEDVRKNLEPGKCFFGLIIRLNIETMLQFQLRPLCVGFACASPNS